MFKHMGKVVISKGGQKDALLEGKKDINGTSRMGFRRGFNAPEEH